MNYTRNNLFAAVLAAAVVFCSGSATAGDKPVASSPAPSTQAATTARLQQSAKTAQQQINLSKAETEALVNAVKTNNVAQAKAILLKHGFATADLEACKIILNNTPPPSAAKLKWPHIEVSYDPLTHTLTIKLVWKL